MAPDAMVVVTEAGLITLMREVSRRILARNGCTVMTAPGGDSALELVRRHDGRIDPLISDGDMPKMLGKEVAERVPADTRVLFMSGYARPVLTENGILGGEVTLVAKPFSEGPPPGRPLRPRRLTPAWCGRRRE